MGRVIAVLILLLVACGQSRTDTPGPSSTAAGGLTTAERVMAEAEGRWQCEVSRRTYQDPAEIPEYRRRFLATLDVSPNELDAFLEANRHRPEVRAAIARAYDESCTG